MFDKQLLNVQFSNNAQQILNISLKTPMSHRFRNFLGLYDGENYGGQTDEHLKYILFPLQKLFLDNRLNLHLPNTYDNVYTQDYTISETVNSFKEAHYMTAYKDTINIAMWRTSPETLTPDKIRYSNEFIEYFRKEYPNLENDLIDVSNVIRKICHVTDEGLPVYGFLDPTTNSLYIHTHQVNRNIAIMIPSFLVMILYILFRKQIPYIQESADWKKYETYARLIHFYDEKPDVQHGIKTEVFVPLFAEMAKTLEKSLYNSVELQKLLVEGFTQSIEKQAKDRINAELRSLKSNYDQYYERLVQSTQEIHRLELVLAQPIAYSDKLINLCMECIGNSNINILKLYTDEDYFIINMEVTSPINYDPDFLTMPMIKDYTRRRLFFEGIHDGTIGLFFKQPLTVKISNRGTIRISPTRQLNISHYATNNIPYTYPNIHHNNFSCFGSYETEMQRAYRYGNYQILVAYLIQSVGMLNIGDGAVFPVFSREILDRDDFTVLYYPENRPMLLHEYYDLRQKEERTRGENTD